ncbi:hypothetical protein AB1K56_08060 [Microbacterium sp. BWR-S6Y]|uniref:hypothetical protein n=1 Tax=Microbacterium sp. BWR-S6Y TaxID=3232073 RepID=UPI003528D9F4
MTIEDVTVFPGSLTHRQAFVWAIRPLLGFPHRIRYRVGYRAWRIIYAAADRIRGIRANLKKGVRR